jgi:hypothetical protein
MPASHKLILVQPEGENEGLQEAGVPKRKYCSWLARISLAFAELFRKAIKIVFESRSFTLGKKLWLDIMENQPFGRHHKLRGDGNFLDIPERPVVRRPHAPPPA